MVEVPVATLPKGGNEYRGAPGAVRPRPPSRGSSLATDERIRWSPLALSEARRAWNRDRIGLVPVLRCECARSSCRDRVPSVADTHRKAPGQFVVTPAHFEWGVVVRAADRFFVVEPREL